MEETVILNFEVDQGKAEQDLKRLEGVILDNKKAQQELSKAYKEGTITQEEYVEENLRLQQNLKKEQEQKKVLIKTINTESSSRNALKLKVSQLTKEYDSLNTSTATGIKRADALEKELAQLNAQLTKGDKSAGLFKNQIGNYPEKFSQAASQIRVAGVSVGDLTTKLAAFANPATAVVGIVGALGTAYANSTRGAKDLEFAQNQLSISAKLLSNAFASIVSPDGGDGKGFFSSAIREILNRFIPAIGTVVDIVANLREELEDLGRDELEVRDANNQRLEKNQELLETIANDQTKLNEKLEAANQIEENLVTSKAFILQILNEELKNLEQQLGFDRENEELQTSILQKKREISKESASFEKQLTKINKQQDDLNIKIGQEVALRKKAADEAARLQAKGVFGAKPIGEVAVSTELEQRKESIIKEGTLATIEGDKYLDGAMDRFNKEADAWQAKEERKRSEAEKTAARQAELNRQQLEMERAAATGILAIGSSLAHGLSALAEEQSEEQKALALAGIAFDTASAIAGGVAASQDLLYPANLVAMASTIAAILSAIAQAEAVISGYAEGGYTGPGPKYKPAGVVHAGEVVWSQKDVAMAGGPAMADSLRPTSRGYADGGYVANLNTQPAQQSMIVANALRNMPPIYASWTEARAVGNKLAFKENRSTL